MKKVQLTALGLLAAVTLSACNTSSSTGQIGQIVDLSQSQKQKQTIRVWMDDEAGEYMEALVAAFEVANPDIVVEFQHMGIVDARERLKTFGPSGNGADVFQFPHDHLAKAIQEDLVYALPEEVKTSLETTMHPMGLDIASLYYNETTKEFGDDGVATEKLYAVPNSIESVALFVNNDLLDDLGLTAAPTTYEELLGLADEWAALPTVDEDDEARTNGAANYPIFSTSSHWADSYFVQHIYSAFGFRPFGPNGDNKLEVGFDNDYSSTTTAIEGFENGASGALTWMRDVLKPVVTGAGLTGSVAGGSLFEQGKIPFVITGPWSFEAFNAAGINYSIVDLPSINGKVSRPFAGAVMSAVYKYSPNKDAAVRFVEFTASEEAMEILYEYKSKLPALKTDLLANVAGVAEDDKLQAISHQLQVAIPMPTIPEVQYYWGPGETMIKAVWDSGTQVSTAVASAETSYLTNLDLGN